MHNIKVNVLTENINSADGVNITIKAQSKKTGLIEREKSTKTKAIDTNTRNVSVDMQLDLTDIDFIHLYVDPNNVIEEPKQDNYASVPFIKDKLRAYLDINTGNKIVDTAVRDYLGLFVYPVEFSEKQLIISVGRFAVYSKESSLINSFLLREFKRGLRNAKVVYDNSNVGSKPYTALVHSFRFDGDNYLFAYGNGVEGDISAVKILLAHSSVFLSLPKLTILQKAVVVDEHDVSGISVFDLLHNNESEPFFLKKSGFESERFSEIVSNVLNDVSFDVSFKSVKTLNTTSYNQSTTLRLMHVNSDFSDRYQDVIVGNSKPVVLGSGLWGNLFSFEKFGKELAFNSK
ncbi:MAG: hypothetical protein AAB014_06890, partial [Nitrospirota bacterium]